jgi:hypothetical protein
MESEGASHRQVGLILDAGRRDREIAGLPIPLPTHIFMGFSVGDARSNLLPDNR